MRSLSPTYTLEEALSSIGFGKFQGLVLAYAGFGWITEAMEIMLLSFVGPTVQAEWGLSSSEESLITTVVFAGMLVGSYSWGLISDAYGRRKAFLGSATVTAGAGMISAFSPNYLYLVIFRCLLGVGLGGGHVFMSWFLEFVPTPNRGAWMIIFSSFWTLGTIFEASVAWIIMPRFGWRWLLALSSLPAFLVILFSIIVPESPRYLCVKGRTTEAHNILQRAALVNRTGLPIGVLVSNQNLKAELPISEETYLLSSTRMTSNDSEKCASSFKLLLSRKLIRTTLLLWFLFFGNTFSYYGIILLTSELSSGQNKCGSVHRLSETMHGGSLYFDVFITSFAELPGLLFAAIIVDRVGRKLSMEIMLAIGFILLLPLVSYQQEMLTMALLFGARMFVSASFTVAYVYAPEVYPTTVRSTGLGVATAIGRIGGMVCPLVAVGLVSSCHQRAAIILFDIIVVLSGLCVMFLTLETKGRDLTDTVVLLDSEVVR